MELDKDVLRLADLQKRYTELSETALRNRTEIARCLREVGEARVSAVLEPEENSAKSVEARIKRAETEAKAAEAELQKGVIERGTLEAAISRLEAEALPQRHAAALVDQAATREKYAAIALRILKAASELEAASTEARVLYDAAASTYPKDCLLEGQPPVRQYGGLAQIWDAEWSQVGTSPNATRREHAVGLIWEWDRTLVDIKDPAALLKLHQENYRVQRGREIEAERKRQRGE